MIRTEELAGLPVHDQLLGRLEGDTVHAVRLAAPVYLLDVPDDAADRPAVQLALHHLATRRGRLWEVPAAIAPDLVSAIADDDSTTLAALAAQAITTTKEIQ